MASLFVLCDPYDFKRRFFWKLKFDKMQAEVRTLLQCFWKVMFIAWRKWEVSFELNVLFFENDDEIQENKKDSFWL